MDFLNSRRSFNLAALKNMSTLRPDVTKHLVRVYLSLAMTMAFAVVGTYCHLIGMLQGGLLSMVAGILVFLWIRMSPSQKPDLVRNLSLWSLGFFQGLSCGPLIDLVLRIDPRAPMLAFSGSVVVFGCFTAAALLAKRREYLYLGGILMSALSLYMWLSFVNIFFGSLGIFKFQLYFGLLMACGFVLFDTQLVLEKADLKGDRDYVLHATDLFIDFFDIFVRILILITRDRQEDNRRRR